MKTAVNDVVAAFVAEDGLCHRYPAVLFRDCVYVAAPRHLDAINLAFAGMTQQQALRVSHRIAEGKETMLFGTAKGDGSEWEWDEKNQPARMQMYGFHGFY